MYESGKILLYRIIFKNAPRDSLYIETLRRWTEETTAQHRQAARRHISHAAKV